MNYTSVWLDESWALEQLEEYMRVSQLTERERVATLLRIAQDMHERNTNPDMMYSWQKPQEVIPLEP